MSRDEFIATALRKHGPLYDYSQVVYVNSYTKITLICKTHGHFQQKPDKHLFGNGCRRCADELRSKQQSATLKEFLAAARKIHGPTYIYTHSVYKNRQTPLTIICKQHGEFQQTPTHHLRGSGCPRCSHARCSKNFTMTHKMFLKRARETHGPRYVYLSRYVHSTTKMRIRCKEHGIFMQAPKHHIGDRAGCPKCAVESRILLTTGNTTKFIADARKVHGDRYLYDDTLYVGSHDPVIIRCRWHGCFRQTPSAHLQNKGCRKCAVFGIYRQALFDRNPERSKQAAILYLLVMTFCGERFVKIGITTTSLDRRCASFGKRFSIRIVREVPMRLGEAFLIEQAVRREYGKWAIVPTQRIRGNTECFGMGALRRIRTYFDFQCKKVHCDL